MAKCKFTTKYWDHESQKEIPYNCDSENVDVLDSGLCIFHEKRYLEDYVFHRDQFGSKIPVSRTERVTERLMEKLNDSIANQKALFCIGYYFPDNITIKGNFTKPVYFNQAKFQRIDFSLAEFSEKAYFGSAEFSKFANFKSAKFSKAYFGSAEFSKFANFESAKFSGEADFFSAKFSEKAYFGSAEFSKFANFESAKFSGEADFFSAKFSENANFFSAKFSGEADFFSAEFSEKAYFGSAEFSEKAYFGSAEFSGEAYFGSAEFSGEADFFSAKFSGEANFESAKFSGEADFGLAKFSGEANFESAKFSGEADFGLAKFSGEADFFSAEFFGEADFNSAEFFGEADFNSAEFFGEADFSSTFKDKTYFNYVLFEDGKKILLGKIEDLSNFSFMNTDITRVRFSDRARWGKKDPFKVVEEEVLEQFVKYSFDWDNITTTDKYTERFKDLLRQIGVTWKGELQLAKHDKTIFIKSTSNSISVENDTSYTTVQIDNRGSYVFTKSQKQINSIFIEVDDNIKKAILSIDGKKSYEFTVKEEEDRLKLYPAEVSLGSVMAVYRNLRENYEYRLRYDEAGKFFIKEMELKRQYREVKNISRDNNSSYNVVRNGWLRKNFSLTGVYYHLSRYGEDLLRPTLAGITIVFLSTLFWLIQANPVHEPSISHIVGFSQVGNSTQWQKAFERSFADLLPLLPLGSDIKVGIADYVIKIVGGALTFGLIAIALRRKFERKYTR